MKNDVINAIFPIIRETNSKVSEARMFSLQLNTRHILFNYNRSIDKHKHIEEKIITITYCVDTSEIISTNFKNRYY